MWTRVSPSWTRTRTSITKRHMGMKEAQPGALAIKWNHRRTENRDMGRGWSHSWRGRHTSRLLFLRVTVLLLNLYFIFSSVLFLFC